MDSDLRKLVLEMREKERKKQLILEKKVKRQEIEKNREWVYLERKANRFDERFINNGSVLVLKKDYKNGWFGYVRVLFGKPIGFGCIKL